MSKQISRAVLSVVVIIGIAALYAGCPTEGGDPGDTFDTWSTVTSLSQLDGIWKGPIEGLNSTQSDVNGTISTASSGEMTYTVSASAKTISISGTATTIYVGAKIASVWESKKSTAEALFTNKSEYTLTFQTA